VTIAIPSETAADGQSTATVGMRVISARIMDGRLGITFNPENIANPPSGVTGWPWIASAVASRSGLLTANK
jgi:hypothetical protein